MKPADLPKEFLADPEIWYWAVDRGHQLSFRGPSKETKQGREVAAEQVGLSREQAGLMGPLLEWSKEDRARRDELAQPAIDFYTELASGDQARMTQAAAPMLTQLAQQYKTGRENIMVGAPRGAAQDFALSQLPIMQAGQTAQALYEPYISSFDKLANIGSGYGQFSLQELGAMLRAGEGAQAGYSGAGQTLGWLTDAAAKRSAAKWGFGGELAKVGGGVLADILTPAASTAGTAGAGAGAGGFSGLEAGIGFPSSGATTTGGSALASAATPAAMMAATYPIAKAPDWLQGRPPFGQGSDVVAGAPVDYIGPPNLGLYWVPTERGMKWGTAQDYYNATGQWPPGYVPPA